ncbi:MAG: dihydrodipicolinate synthase family protein, partial [Lachnospiraceae bacterium]|nr:dihydrodipicolinate synthase family protein [Lachnospiraceae bacterium]
KAEGGADFGVVTGPDEQLVSGLAIGADGGIGGTYGVMPELYLKILELVRTGDVARACEIQNAADAIIYGMCECHGNLYAVMKAIMKIRDGLDLGGVRKPMPNLIDSDMEQVRKRAGMIDEAVAKYA